jgi:hypothetical protein
MGWLAHAVRIAVLAVLLGSGTASQAPASNPVVRENAKPGTSAWAVRPPSTPDAIEAYATSPTVGSDGVLDLHVDTSPTARYRVLVYRLGWYGGRGGRLLRCVPSCTTDEQGPAASTPAFDPRTGWLDAGWPVTDRVHVGHGWISGYYLADAVLTSGPDAGTGARVAFVVRAPLSQRSAILVQVPVTTWEAYNAWGGRSLYVPNEAGVVNNHVSFERPYDTVPFAAGSPQQWELPLLRFLERNGLDVTYQTDLDTDRHPGSLLAHRLVIVAGHSEYWSHGVRLALDRARDAGTNLAFLGANDGYWQVRYTDASRLGVIEYRNAALDPEPDPGLKTTRFRQLTPPRPECELMGVEFSTTPHSEGGPFPYTVASVSADPWFDHTGLTSGRRLAGLVGPEWDAPSALCPPTASLTVLLSYGGPPVPAEAVRYTAPSGARVFSAGSLDFVYALDDNRFLGGVTTSLADRGVQQFMLNALRDLERPAS